MIVACPHCGTSHSVRKTGTDIICRSCNVEFLAGGKSARPHNNGAPNAELASGPAAPEPTLAAPTPETTPLNQERSDEFSINGQVPAFDVDLNSVRAQLESDLLAGPEFPEEQTDTDLVKPDAPPLRHISSEAPVVKTELAGFGFDDVVTEQMSAMDLDGALESMKPVGPDLLNAHTADGAQYDDAEMFEMSQVARLEFHDGVAHIVPVALSDRDLPTAKAIKETPARALLRWWAQTSGRSRLALASIISLGILLIISIQVFGSHPLYANRDTALRATANADAPLVGRLLRGALLTDTGVVRATFVQVKDARGRLGYLLTSDTTNEAPPIEPEYKFADCVAKPPASLSGCLKYGQRHYESCREVCAERKADGVDAGDCASGCEQRLMECTERCGAP